MNTQLIQDIILTGLHAVADIVNSQERKEVAEKVAQALTLASLEQLAALMGTNLSYDCDGQALIFTGVYDADKADEIALNDLQASARVVTNWEALDALRREFANDDVDPTEVP